MKKNSYIINTSRGEIVNENDIIQSLESSKLKGYATDVVDDEFGGNNDGLLNPGEYVGLHLYLTNLDDNYLTNITGYIESDNENE